MRSFELQNYWDHTLTYQTNSDWQHRPSSTNTLKHTKYAKVQFTLHDSNIESRIKSRIFPFDHTVYIIFKVLHFFASYPSVGGLSIPFLSEISLKLWISKLICQSEWAKCERLCYIIACNMMRSNQCMHCACKWPDELDLVTLHLHHTDSESG